jgi:predicted PurR-regulated permease PerM
MAEISNSGNGGQTNWKSAALFMVTLALLTVCGFMLYPFLPAIAGAIVLASVIRRPFRWWRAKVRNRTVAASSALLLVTISIVGPVLLLLHYLIRLAINGAEMLQNGQAQRGFDAFLNRFPQLAAATEGSSEFINFGEAVQKIAGFAASYLVSLLSNSVAAIGQIVIMLFLLFFLFRDQDMALDFFSRLLPLTPSESEAFRRRLGETIRATVVGRLAVAVAQGTVAGGIFAALGVHAAVILGLLTAIAAVLPPFGPYIVWVPVALWFALTGHWIKMAILLAVGSLIISTLDNFLYPALVGSQLRQHTVSVFLSLLGGIWLFGLPGLVLGPLVFSATEALLAIWKLQMNGASSVAPGSDTAEMMVQQEGPR